MTKGATTEECSRSIGSRQESILVSKIAVTALADERVLVQLVAGYIKPIDLYLRRAIWYSTREAIGSQCRLMIIGMVLPLFCFTSEYRSFILFSIHCIWSFCIWQKTIIISNICSFWQAAPYAYIHPNLWILTKYLEVYRKGLADYRRRTIGW